MIEKEQPNPWLSISASDYEAHMGESGANQLTFLGEAFRDLLAEFRPETVAILGCATGNGFEYIDSEAIRLLVGIDINPEYIDIARARFNDRLPNVQLFSSDIKNIELAPRSLDLISCGLFFEHVNPKLVMAKVFRWMKPGGIFATVLQLPAESEEAVSDTGVESVKLLEPVVKLVDPEFLTELAESAGFQLLRAKTETLETGKSFRVLIYRLKN